ncbi:MAG: hypothetical protein ACJ77Z_11770 [Thermoleophilaceae bacterium]
MEDAPRLDWTKAELDAENGTVAVPWVPPGPSGEMGEVLTQLLLEWEQDSRRQQWGSVVVYEHGVIAHDVDALAGQALRVYLARAADHAQLELDRQLKATAARKEREER